MDGPNGCLVRALPEDRQWRVTGEVVYINHAHHWYRVRYQLPGADLPQHECFPLPVERDPEPPKYNCVKQLIVEHPPRPRGRPRGSGTVKTA